MLLQESKAELRTSVITMISSKHAGYNYFIFQCAVVCTNAGRFTDNYLSSDCSFIEFLSQRFPGFCVESTLLSIENIVH